MNSEEGSTEDPETPPESSRRRVGRDLKLATVTGLTLAAMVIGLLFLGAEAFFALAFVVILIAQAEFYMAVRRAGHEPATTLGVVAGAAMLLGVFNRGEAAAGVVLFLTMLFGFLWYLSMHRRTNIVSDLAITVLGVAYIPMLGSFAGLLTKACQPGAHCPPTGGGIALTMIGAAAIYDIAAFAGGSLIGKTPLVPSISPRKTREGALVATIVSLVVITSLAPVFGPWDHLQALVLAVLVSVAAPLGDLVESMIKRDLGIKDMGGIFPGHGGALDRIDAILFVAPAVYLSLKIFAL